MTTEAQAQIKESVTAEALPGQQSVLMPNAGTGITALYLGGSPGATQLFIYYTGNGGNVQVLYGQNYSEPTTPLPVGMSTYPLNNGFNISWSSDGSPFKIAWGVA